LLKILKINLIGAFNVSKHAAKFMASQPEINGERGVIINVSSVLAEDGKTNHVIYSASKGAISAMTLPMARDLGPKKIRVMSIAPGMFDTPMN
jgi:NAD(P)-dependent dehydrogenase (short-subunit alcohol dehydrogenase family)